MAPARDDLTILPQPAEGAVENLRHMEANMTEPSQQESTSHVEKTDPAQVWWGDAAGRGVRPQVPVTPMPVEEPWRWRYSAWTGIMYGPIPVGLIIGLPILLVLFAR